MLDRTVRKGDLYETLAGVKVTADKAGLIHDGRIVSVASMIGSLTELGYVIREKRKAKDEPVTSASDAG